jgi:benzylsuccinate CoA-transferase BbsF subunit
MAPPYRPGGENLEGSGYFASRNTSKKSFALDMSKPRAREIALALAEHCSVVTSNFRPGVMERWGLCYDDVRARNPSVIYLTMPMQGSSGPHASYTGFGSTIAALSGLVHLSGRPDRPPVGTGTHYPDHVPNPGHALVALLAALRHRARTGQGQAIEIAQLESTINVIGQAFVDDGQTAGRRDRDGNRVPGASPHGVFPCAGDDRWIAIACLSDDNWRDLCSVLGQPEMAADQRFATLLARKANEDEVDEWLASRTQERERTELVAALRACHVPAAAVNSSRDVLSDAALEARGYWQRVSHPVIGEMAIARPPFRVNDGSRPDLGRAPLIGEHTRQIAADLLAMDDATIDQLVDAGVLA